MSETTMICKMKGYIQPFERRLALMELESLANTAATPEPSLLDEPLNYQLLTTRSPDDLADKLTYWESVGPAGDYGRYTRQVRREATANVVRNGITPLQLRSLLPFEADDSSSSKSPNIALWATWCPRVSRQVLPPISAFVAQYSRG